MLIRLSWDDRAIGKVAQHSVTREEVEEVVYDVRSLIVKASTRQRRYIVFGQTGSGRYLKVVVDPLGRGLFYPVTAYEMAEADRKRYCRKRR